MKRVLYILAITSVISCQSPDNKGDYRDSSLPTAERVGALLAQMTPEEKVAQLQCYWKTKAVFWDSSQWFSADSARKHAPHGLGQVGRPSEGRSPAENAQLTNAIQRYFIEDTRLGIPVIFHEECLHGHAAIARTSFSQPIGLASTWNTALVEQLYAMTAKEARAVGTHLALTPVLDVAREPRWGRVEETFGEDPYLVGQMGLAAVRGFQGRSEKVGPNHIMSTLKHYAAHGQPESGTNIGPVPIGERTLRETFLAPFQVAVQQGHAKAIMASYNEVDGLPSHASPWLLHDVLRNEWGFEGVVVSDYYGVEELHLRHKVAENLDHAGRMALESGVDVELPEPVSFLNLKAAVEAGQLNEKYLNRAVSRVLTQKFDMGLFEQPYVNEALVEEKVNTAAHHQLALKAAEETMVLLENEGGLLPLNPEAGLNLAVIGPNANRELQGGYSGEPSYFVPVLEGLQAKFGAEHVTYAEGCSITKDSVLVNGEWVTASWYADPVELASREENLRKIAEAVKVARQADVVVLCIGGNELTSREAWAESHMGDRANLQLVGEQLELLKALAATGKPIVTLLFNGKPLALGQVKAQSQALLECWYLGSECGNAVANVLAGTVNPSGKLPISFPRSVGHIPSFYNYKPTARRGYLLDSISPLYAFGYGLSYTQFTMGEPSLSTSEVSVNALHQGDSVEVAVTLANTGALAGSQVVQLYVRDNISSVTRPIKELKAFKKVNLAPDVQKNIRLKVGYHELAFWNQQLEYTVEPGTFTLMVGTSSRNEDLATITLTVIE